VGQGDEVCGSCAVKVGGWPRADMSSWRNVASVSQVVKPQLRKYPAIFGGVVPSHSGSHNYWANDINFQITEQRDHSPPKTILEGCKRK
jgi:hypothetical protein